MKLSEFIRMAAETAPDANELEMGRKVEMEHRSTIEHLKKHPDTPLEKVVEMIALDHLKEISDYYTRLKRMEEKGKTPQGAEGDIETEIIKFFKANPDPNDDQVHELATKLKLEPDVLETHIYALLSDLLS